MAGKNVTARPVSGSDRIQLLDIYRGFALLGIYVVNIRYMSSSVIYPEAFSWMFKGQINSDTWWVLENFFNNKFFPIFSFLFGVGFGMQIKKKEDKSNYSNLFFIRRYLVLFLFGLLHIIFIWPGDVLALYAIAGLLVLIIQKLPSKYILIIALAILLFPFYAQLRNYINNGIISLGLKSLMFLYDFNYRQIVEINTDWPFVSKVWFRLHEYTVYYRNVEYFPILLSLIFLGFIAGRAEFYKKIGKIFRWLSIASILALIYIILIKLMSYHYSQKEVGFELFVILKKLQILSNICQSYLYLFLITLMSRSKILVKTLEPLTYVGRMSLTNYILQSVIGVFLFKGFINWYGRISLVNLEVIAIIVFSIMLLASRYWLKSFRYGPLEWLWRKLSYGKNIK